MEEMRQQIQHWRAFDDDWFDRHQRLLLRLANAPIVGERFRQSLGLREKLVITLITPVAVHYVLDDERFVADIYNAPRIAKRIYEAYKPLWWGLHYYDEVFADRFAPELSYGFNTLTMYVGPGNTPSFDSSISSESTTSWAACLVGNNLFTDDTGSLLTVEASRTGTSPAYDFYCSRTFVKFDLASLSSSNLYVSSAYISLYMEGRLGASLHDIHLREATLTDASSGLTSADWSKILTTDLATPMAMAAFNSGSYTDWALNADGVAMVKAEAGTYAKFVLQHSRDVSGFAVTSESYITFRSADYAGQTYDPKITVVYSYGIYANGIAVTPTFGSATITQTAPPIIPLKLSVNITIGQPIVTSGAAVIQPVGLAINVSIGSPIIPIIMASGIAVTPTFGNVRIPVIMPDGIAVDVGFGDWIVRRGKIIRVEAGQSATPTFGDPAIYRGLRVINASGAEVDANLGRPFVTIPYPDEIHNNGPMIAKLVDEPIAYGRTLYEFEDGGAEVNIAPCGARRWAIEYHGLTMAEVESLTRHYNAMRGKSGIFTFYHRRDLTSYVVRYVSMDIAAHSKNWANSVNVVLEALQ